MNKIDVDKQRDAIIEEIKKVFPKHWHPKGKRNLTRGGGYLNEANDLKSALEGRTWQDVVSNPHIIYYMSDPDYIAALTERAYDYYLPAFLVATANEPSSWTYYSFVLDKLVVIARKSKKEKLKVLVAWLEFQYSYFQVNQLFEDDLQMKSLTKTLQTILNPKQ